MPQRYSYIRWLSDCQENDTPIIRSISTDAGQNKRLHSALSSATYYSFFTTSPQMRKGTESRSEGLTVPLWSSPS